MPKCPFIVTKPEAERPWCCQCEQEVDVIVVVGETPFYDTATARICKTCLLEALALFP